MSTNYKSLKLAILAAALGIAGCSGLDIPQDVELPSKEEMADGLKQQWTTTTPAIREVRMKRSFVIDSPERIPDSIAKKRVQVTFSKDSTLDDLSSVLNPLGFYMVVPNEELRKKSMVIYEYEGTFGDFMNALSFAHDLSFSWLPGNVMMVQEDKPYILQIPQNENVSKAIQENITALGAKDAKVSVQAGTIHYRASENNQRKIVEMVKSMGLNAAVVSMQVAIVNVTLDRERNTGFDWGSLKVGIGAQDLANTEEETATLPTTGTDTTGTPTSSTEEKATLGSNLKDMAAYMGLTKEGIALNLAKGDFNFMSAFRMLSTYGEARTAQSVLMDSLSGEEVTLKSGQKVPYIESVGVNSSNNVNSANSLGSTDISEVDIGLELKLTPFYDHRSQTVTIGVDLSLSSLLRYVELSAGNQLGSVSRPLTQEQAFTDLVRVRAGESLIIGGLTYDSINDNRSNLTFLEKTDTASQAKKISRTAMFILMRPTVTVFESSEAQ